jgi:hypothetical protein
MVEAVVSCGEIRPPEPLPADCREGQPLRIEKADYTEMLVEEIDRDFAVLASCARGASRRTRISWTGRCSTHAVKPRSRFGGAWGSIYVELPRHGRALSLVDMMLAAMARQHKPAILTTDRDFEALSDLAVENWVV